MDLADLVTDIAAGLFTIPELKSPLSELAGTSLGISFFLFFFQDCITKRDSRGRKVKKLVTLIALFFEDGIMLPINVYQFWEGYSVGDKPNPHQVSELAILALSVAVGATVGVIKVTSFVYDYFWQDKVFQGDYGALVDFLKKENGFLPKFLIPNLIYRIWCRKRSSLDLENIGM